MKIIAFFGPQGSGKSEAANAIAALPNWRKQSFAGPLYNMMSTLLMCDAREERKTACQEGLCGHSLRYGLQTLGTEWGRVMIGEDIWVNAMRRRLELCEEDGVNVVIDDLRFLNEYHMLRDLGAKVVRMNKGTMTGVGTHASETDWLDFKPDLCIENFGVELEAFHRYVRETFRGLDEQAFEQFAREAIC